MGAWPGQEKVAVITRLGINEVKARWVSTVSGAPNEKNIGKRFKCSFLLSHIVLRSFKGTFARANTN